MTSGGAMKTANPYRSAHGQWLRGTFHAHCKEHSPCASVPLSEGVPRYQAIGARFLAVTDHDCVTDLAPLRAAFPDMVFLEGFEHSNRENILFVGERVPPLYKLPLEEALARAGSLLTILCHPEPRIGQDYWTRDKILALGQLPDGIEIFNGHYSVPMMLANGCNPLYTRNWDELLTDGHRLWGFANDDFHDPPDFNNAFNMVLVEEVSAEAIIGAARSGRFYASTGLLLERIDESDGRIAVVTAAPCAGRFIGPGGRILAEAQGQRFEFTISCEPYVRFEARGPSGLLFLQPIFRE